MKQSEPASAKVILINVDELKQIVAEAVHDSGKTYNIKEAAQILKVSVPTITKLIHTNRLRGTMVGKRILISQGAINEFHKGV